MAVRTQRFPGRAGFIGDFSSIERAPTGRQIDWANVGAGFLNAVTGKKELPAGTVVGDLLGSGKISPRVLTTNPAIGILETEAIEGDPKAPLSGYGVIIGGVINENFLPDSSGGPPRTLAAAIKTELQTAGVGSFRFTTLTNTP